MKDLTVSQTEYNAVQLKLYLYIKDIKTIYKKIVYKTLGLWNCPTFSVHLMCSGIPFQSLAP